MTLLKANCDMYIMIVDERKMYLLKIKLYVVIYYLCFLLNAFGKCMNGLLTHITKDDIVIAS